MILKIQVDIIKLRNKDIIQIEMEKSIGFHSLFFYQVVFVA